MDQRFFINTSLYSAYPILLDEWHIGSITTTTLQRYCEPCKGERTWQEVNTLRRVIDRPEASFSPVSSIAAGNPHRNRNPESEGDSRDIRDRLVSFVFRCGACRAPVKFIVHFEPRELSFAASIEQRKSGVVPSSNGIAMKVGQYPGFDIEVPDTLRSSLGNYLKIFKNGAISESHGFGIGAFAYYRRIVELVIDDLLKDIRLLMSSAELQAYDVALRSVESTIVAQEKIAVVKDLLPSSVRPGGLNPLSLLHESLSVGIHSSSDEDCLSIAAAIREALIILSRHIALAKEEKSKVAGSLMAVKDNLDRIRKKGNK